MYIDGQQSERNIDLSGVIDLDLLPRFAKLRGQSRHCWAALAPGGVTTG
jgi:hypothetical protein